jgi:hypothetical protein
VFAADRTTRASITESFLAFGLTLRPSVIAGLLLEAPQAGPGRTAGAGIVMSEADDLLLDPSVRLLRLADRPDDVRVVGPAIEREIQQSPP